MFEKQNNSLPGLNDEVASAIMDNVFSACGQAPSTVPLKVLSSYTEYRRDRYSLQKTVLIFVLIVFLLLPICFISPHFTVNELGRYDTGVPSFEVRVSNFVPVRLVSARLNDRPVAVYESQAKVFTVEPTANGVLTITVTLANKQFQVWSTEISGVDATAPILVNSEVLDGNLRIYLQDEGVGVNYKNIYAVSSTDVHIAPAGYNEAENYVEFKFDSDLNIFIPDHNANTLQLVLTIRPPEESAETETP